MFTRSKFAALVAMAVAVAMPSSGQNRLDPQSTMHITLPEDGPVALLSAGWGDSTASPRGGAILLELHTSLALKNTSQRRIRGFSGRGRRRVDRRGVCRFVSGQIGRKRRWSR